MKKVVSCIVLIFLLGGLLQNAFGESRKECKVCGMYIDLYQKTAGHLEVKGERLLNRAAWPVCFGSSMIMGDRTHFP